MNNINISVFGVTFCCLPRLNFHSRDKVNKIDRKTETINRF